MGAEDQEKKKEEKKRGGGKWVEGGNDRRGFNIFYFGLG